MLDTFLFSSKAKTRPPDRGCQTASLTPVTSLVSEVWGAGCGAMKHVIRSSEDRGHIILISALDDDNNVSKLDFETVEENFKYYNIRVSFVLLHTGGGQSPHFSALASIQWACPVGQVLSGHRLTLPGV